LIVLIAKGEILCSHPLDGVLGLDVSERGGIRRELSIIEEKRLEKRSKTTFSEQKATAATGESVSQTRQEEYCEIVKDKKKRRRNQIQRGHKEAKRDVCSFRLE
jgi:hypothetical protein